MCHSKSGVYHISRGIVSHFVKRSITFCITTLSNSVQLRPKKIRLDCVVQHVIVVNKTLNIR